MGKRKGGGGGGGTSASVVLRRHIESCKHKYPTIEELVDHLRSNYTHYSRQKVHPLTRAVKNMLDIINSKDGRSRPTISSSPMDEEGEVVVGDDPPSRKRHHIEKRQKLVSASETSSSEEEDGAVSTSEDAIYEQKVGPKFDFVKSSLRANYSAVKSKTKEATVEKSIEVEDVGSSKAAMNIDLVGGKSNLGKGKSSGDFRGGDQGNGKQGTRFSDLGGMASVIEDLKTDVLNPMLMPHYCKWIGVRPQTGILLHGPPGCGKTKLAEAIGFELGMPFYKIAATEFVSGVSGGSEENIRGLFAKAYRTAPSIVFIDEIDAIASKRDSLQREMEKRIVTQLMTCMDDSHRPVQPDVAPSAEASSSSSDEDRCVLVIGATNRPDNIDPALRRPGRFDREIALGVPDEAARLEILVVLSRKFRLQGSFDLLKIARSTPGYVGADLNILLNEAGKLALNRIALKLKTEFQNEPTNGNCIEPWWKKHLPPEEMETIAITMADVEEALKKVQPSSKREGFTSIPDVKWEDVGGMESVREVFYRYIIKPIKYPDVFKEFNVNTEKGFLLYGPPGCGKTLIAKAVANEAGANFIHIKSPELLSKYVGESEKEVRKLFYRARTCSPCILFFDEVDALTTKRGNEGGWVVERLLTQLLIELDGGDDRSSVYVIAATNRPHVIDSAFLRAGRVGKHLHVSLPSPNDRGLILKALTRKNCIDPSVDLLDIGKDTTFDRYSGADLRTVVNEAAHIALDERLGGSDVSTICRRHFVLALQKISPSLSEKEVRFYDNWSIEKKKKMQSKKRKKVA